MTANQHRLARAWERHQAGDLAAAEPIYRRILEAEPRHPDALELLGVICGQSDRLDQAARHLTAAAAVRPESARVHYNLGNVERDRRRPDAAVAAYRRAIERDATHVSAHLNLGLVLLHDGHVDAARAALEGVLALDPGHARAWHHLALLEFDRGEFAAAADAWGRAIAAEPAVIDHHHNRAVALLRDDRLGDAAAAAEAALAVAPDSVPTLCALTAVLRQANRYDEALACGERAVGVDPESADAQHNLANVHLCRGELAAARRRCERALALRPGHPEAAELLGLIEQRDLALTASN